jgi:hypothetical protein
MVAEPLADPLPPGQTPPGIEAQLREMAEFIISDCDSIMP